MEFKCLPLNSKKMYRFHPATSFSTKPFRSRFENLGTFFSTERPNKWQLGLMIDKCCEYVSQWIQTKETSRERKGVNEVFIWLGEIISLEYFLPFYSSCCRFRNNRSTFYSAFYIRILFLFSDMFNVALKKFCNIFSYDYSSTFNTQKRPTCNVSL